MFVLGPMSGCHRAPDHGMTFAMRSLIAARRVIVMALAVIAVLFLTVVSSTAQAGAHEHCSARQGPGGSISGDDADRGPGDGGGDDCTPAPVTVPRRLPAATSPAPPSAAVARSTSVAAVVPPSSTASPHRDRARGGRARPAVDVPTTASGRRLRRLRTSDDAVAAVPAAAATLQLVGTGTDSHAGKLVPYRHRRAIIGLACLVVAGLLARRDLGSCRDRVESGPSAFRTVAAAVPTAARARHRTRDRRRRGRVGASLAREGRRRQRHWRPGAHRLALRRRRLVAERRRGGGRSCGCRARRARAGCSITSAPTCPTRPPSVSVRTSDSR